MRPTMYLRARLWSWWITCIVLNRRSWLPRVLCRLLDFWDNHLNLCAPPRPRTDEERNER
jgi:hypothetical protein